VLQLIGRPVVALDRRGFVDTAAGVDVSKAGVYDEGWACLLPVDPDASERRIRTRIGELTGRTVATIVSDSFGSPYREGSHGMTVGLASIHAPEQPAEGEHDLYGNPAWGHLDRVDELAGAASSLMRQTDGARPVVVIRGAGYTPDEHASISGLLVDVPLPKPRPIRP
jgi:coenzyme F420-0:L-glutamate ligase / coenzyme F420-1:gamma-L-glutamate ligase